jgi:Ala-tRNA(Pro) deacylase
MAVTSDELLAFLAKEGFRTTTIEHPPVFTVGEAQSLRGEISGGHTKNLFLKDRKGGLFLLVALEDARIDLKSVHTLIGATSKVSFGSADLLVGVWGVEPGSVTPFGAINDPACRVKVVLEAEMMSHERLNFHPLINTRTTNISSDDLLRFLRATGHDPLVTGFAASAAISG